MKKLSLILFWVPTYSSKEAIESNNYIEKIRRRNDVKLVMTSRNKEAKRIGEKILFGKGFKILDTPWLDEIYGFEKIADNKEKITEFFEGRIFSDIEAQESVLSRLEQINRLVKKARGLQGSMLLISHKGLLTMYLWKKLEAIVDPVSFYFSTGKIGGFILPEFPYLQNSGTY